MTMTDPTLRPNAAPPASAGDPVETYPPPVRRIALDRQPTVVADDPAQRPAVPPAIERATRPTTGRERLRIDGVSIHYGAAPKPAVNAVTLPVHEGEVLALIGPSGCGKTTLLRSLNRLVELTPGARRDGRILLDGEDIDALELTRLRRRVSMVFQQPNPFPMSIFDNVAYALREQARRRPSRRDLAPRVETALRRAGLWDEVSADLGRPALRLSGGQQQRLCIARALAVEPEVLLMDEPCSALDPLSTVVIERLIQELRSELAIVIVTHNLQQARRVADNVAFMYLGDLVEYGPTEELFTRPRAERTREYVSGSFG
jgi:phosphate transport system ATP-binding protein